MYQAENIRAVLAGRGHGVRGLWPRVNRTVLLLGVTSLFTDISSEMVATILPLYLVYTLGFTPLQFGFIDGLYQGAAALVRIASGLVGDRWSRHKEVAALGYGLSAICKPLFLVVGQRRGFLVAIILIDRTGKGIRTAPRDALISLSTPQDELATAFGVHRALDTVGAMLGPLLAFFLLALRPGHFKPIFVISFCFAVVGLAVLVLFVENRQPADSAPAESVSLRSAGHLLAEPSFRRLVIVGAALGLVTMSDGFLYLGLQRQVDFDPSYLPLLFVGTAAIFMLLAIPAGRIADRIGRARVFLCGFVPLLLRLRPAPGPVVRGARAGDLPGAGRRVLRRDRRCPDGARQRDRARASARQRPRAARDCDESGEARRIDCLRRALDRVRRRDGRDRVRRRPRRHTLPGRDRAGRQSEEALECLTPISNR